VGAALALSRARCPRIAKIRSAVAEERRFSMGIQGKAINNFKAKHGKADGLTGERQLAKRVLGLHPSARRESGMRQGGHMSVAKASWTGSSLSASRLQVIVGLIIFLLFGVPSTAQQKTNDLTELNLEDLMKVEVYSASKHMENASDAPSSVTVVTEDEIQKHGYRTLADILESVRGFYITYDRDYSFVGVRGFGRLGDSNNRILVLIDGHRINDNVFGEPYLGTEFLVDVDLIDHVEIIRGPSSSLYGAYAFFAVINVITRKGEQTRSLELSFAGASFGTYRGRASYGRRFRGIDMMLSGTFYNSYGPSLFFPEFVNPISNYGITRNTDYESSQHILGTLSFHGFTVQGLFSARDKGVPTAYYGGLFNDPQTRNIDRHQYIDVSYHHAIGDKWNLTARTSYDHATLSAPVAYATGLPGGTSTLDTYSFQGSWSDSEVDLNRDFLEKHQVTLGAEVVDNFRQNQGDYTALGNVFLGIPASSVNWALFGQDQFAITHNLILSAGIRYDRYSEFGGTTNPRLGLIYHLPHVTTLKLLYGTAFRAPEPFELRPDYGAFYDNNLQLKPETIRSVEGVVEQGLGAHFTLSGSVFRNWINDLISIESNPGDGHSVYENSGRADATGVEVELDGRFVNGLQGSASYSFTNTVQPLIDQTLANSPRHLGKVGASFPLMHKRFFAAVDAQYTSTVQTLAGNIVSGFGVFNVTLLAHALTKHLDVSASVYNILDKQYFNPGRPEDTEDAIQQDGRNFQIKLIGKF
jgi:outer membrane receptor for ferrienterochelin and colicins